MPSLPPAPRRALLALLAWPAQAGAAPRALNHRRGVVLDGYDPVAWFAEGRPRRGSIHHPFAWGGAIWRFASAETLARFAAAPARFAPAFGGFCAFGVARGYKVDIDPEAWHIQAGRLFLNYDRGVQREWQRDIPGHIATAEANWPRLMDA